MIANVLAVHIAFTTKIVINLEKIQSPVYKM